MSRHTLSDGVTPDERIVLDGVEWRPRLAPPARIVGAHYKGRIDWTGFAKAYHEYLDTVADDVLTLAAESQISPVTILCIEEHSVRCHRRLLAEAVHEHGGNIAALLC